MYVKLDTEDKDGKPLPRLADKLDELANLPADVRALFPGDLVRKNIVAMPVPPMPVLLMPDAMPPKLVLPSIVPVGSGNMPDTTPLPDDPENPL